MIAGCWNDLTWPHTALTGRYYGLLLASEHWIPPSQLSLVWEEKYSLRNNKGSVSRPTSWIPQQQLGPNCGRAEASSICLLEQWRLFAAYLLPPHIHHATPPSQLLFIGQWCSGSDAAASRRQLYTAGTRNLCQNHSPQATSRQQWRRKIVKA